MNLLFRVIHASRCSSTHHKLAIDALRHLKGSFAERWQNLFLKHSDVYLDGSKAPDKRFKDFRNHVLHVQDNHWGGAAKTARKWYELTVRGLRSRNWVQAVYAAGVLSHYYTDPIQPFHTGQSEAENNIHRAAEWSIAKSYDDLFLSIQQRQGFPHVDVPSGDDWLEQMVVAGAELSHAHYEPLTAHYSFDRGVREPRAGLDATCRTFLSELVAYAQVGMARILERAFAQARVTPPITFVTVRGYLATLEIPIRWVTKKIADVHERAEVEAMYRELKATGKVERTLPADDRAVRQMHADEVLAKSSASPSRGRESAERAGAGTALPTEPPLPVTRTLSTASAGPRSSEVSSSRPAAGIFSGAGRGSPADARRPVRETYASDEIDDIALPTESVEDPLDDFPTSLDTDRVREKQPAERDRFGTDVRQTSSRDNLPHRPYLQYPKTQSKEESRSTDRPRAAGGEFDKPDEGLRFYLEVGSPVVDAPSIGPKTAKRFRRIRVQTVADLLRLDPEQASARLGTRHITPQVIRDWQDQARLVCRIPQLRGHDAQILVACSYTAPEQVASADPHHLLAATRKFVATSEGQRVVRSSKPPDLDEVRNWIRWARSARRLEAA